MFTEFELATMAEHPAIKDATEKLKEELKEKEGQVLDLSNHDFLALAMMAPSVGIALANGSVSFFEERALNKKARKLSKGGYFLEKDPVVYYMKFLIKNWETWRGPFLNLIKATMDVTFNRQRVISDQTTDGELNDNQFRMAIMRTPYVLIRYIGSFFMEDDEDIFSSRDISEVEYKAMTDIGAELGLDEIPIFNKICETTFNIR